MSKVTRLPSIFRRPVQEPVATIDPRIAAVIKIQEALADLSDEECAFCIETVQRNLELNRRHRVPFQFED